MPTKINKNILASKIKQRRRHKSQQMKRNKNDNDDGYGAGESYEIGLCRTSERQLLMRNRQKSQLEAINNGLWLCFRHIGSVTVFSYL